VGAGQNQLLSYDLAATNINPAMILPSENCRMPGPFGTVCGNAINDEGFRIPNTTTI